MQEEARQKYIAYVDSLVGPTETSVKPNEHSKTHSAVSGFDVSMNGKLRIIKINKPEKKNALSVDMYGGFTQVI